MEGWRLLLLRRNEVSSLPCLPGIPWRWTNTHCLLLSTRTILHCARENCVVFFFNRLIWVLRAKLYLLEKTNKRRSWEAAVAIGKPGGWGKRRRQCRVMRESRWLPRRSGNVQVGVGSRNGRTECIHGIPVVYTLTFLSVHSKVWQCHMCAEACLTSLTKL